ncbi:hypothetical protein [Vagococcus fluvialis]|uniref:hypothetical protein n=1 Tax=Vagococcus fluvialis TaxID=2738 RepID=UPI001D09A71F|nr:hypothetical protein [Vagococcus fluvialis]UDM73275.1 hypothetical protein K5K99_10090 [Vagococcus fluvialis]
MNSEKFEVSHPLSSKGTELYLVKRLSDGITISLHITQTVIRIVDLNSNLEEFISKQIENTKELIGLIEESAEIFIESTYIESNGYKPLSSKEMNFIIENR